jgi:hypothetical protein
MRWAGYVARMGKMRDAIRGWGAALGKRTLEGPRRRWEDTIEMSQEVRWGPGLDWTSG